MLRLMFVNIILSSVRVAHLCPNTTVELVGNKILLTHLWPMDFPILIIWMSLLSFVGESGVIFHFYFIFR